MQTWYKTQMKYLQYKYDRKENGDRVYMWTTFLNAVTDTMTALAAGRPSGETPTKKSYAFPYFQRDQREELSRKPVSAEPDLSGGHHHDEDQPVTKLTKLIKPVAGNQTPLSWLLILNKESGKAPQVKDTSGANPHTLLSSDCWKMRMMLGKAQL